ncbi:MAG TPA: tetratricopeptide repeat protein, partial [Candidatus Limnocylindrales bacterium]|nr:tetratricopeptide repeat protein [Candidatus Limnocylindrales bacterium]
MSSTAPSRHAGAVSGQPAPATPPVWPDAAMPEIDTAIVGRDEIVADLTDALLRGEPRMVLLSGLGGVGKTRLALEIAARLAEPFDRRIAWIPLARASRDGGLSSALAAAFRLDDGRRDEVAASVAGAVGGGPVLVVLDAIEAVLHDLTLLDELARLAPGARILQTGRMAFERPDLRSVAVNPLAVPRAGDDAAAIAASPSVQLLLERADAAGATISITPRNAPTIAGLVSQLDGMPLAIELAASLLRGLPPHRLLERVRGGLDPIVATIDWSHDQLALDDRRLYRRIAVFGVPFRVRHVRTFDERSVAHGLSPLGPGVAAGLERLVRAGLLRARSDSEELDAATGPDDPRGEHVRLYELPTLIRDDAQRRLEASGEVTAAMWARSNDLLALCEHVDRELAIRTRRDLLDQLDTVHDDVLAALTRARAVGEGRFLLRMTAALAEYWRARGRLAEGRIWLDAALRMGPPEATAERARALHGAGVLANWQSDFNRARGVLEQALEMRLSLGLRAEAAATLNQLGLIGLDQGDLASAERFCRQGLEIRRELGDEAAAASSLNTLGGVLQYGGRVDEARAMFEESLAIRRRLGDLAGASVSLGNLGLVARDARDLASAAAMFR